MRISDWSSDVCSSDLSRPPLLRVEPPERHVEARPVDQPRQLHQRVIHVDHRLQSVAEQIDAALTRLLRRHHASPTSPIRRRNHNADASESPHVRARAKSQDFDAERPKTNRMSKRLNSRYSCAYRT